MLFTIIVQCLCSSMVDTGTFQGLLMLTIYTYIMIRVNIHTYIHTHTYMHTHTCTHTHTHMHIHTHTHQYTCTAEQPLIVVCRKHHGGVMVSPFTKAGVIVVVVGHTPCIKGKGNYSSDK